MEDKIQKALHLADLKKKYDKIKEKIANRQKLDFEEHTIKQAWEGLVFQKIMKEIKEEKNGRNKS